MSLISPSTVMDKDNKNDDFEVHDEPKSKINKSIYGNTTYEDLITQAIETSPKQRLTANQILQFIMDNANFVKEKEDPKFAKVTKKWIDKTLARITKFKRTAKRSGYPSWYYIENEADTDKLHQHQASRVERHLKENEFEAKNKSDQGQENDQDIAESNGTMKQDSPSSTLSPREEDESTEVISLSHTEYRERTSSNNSSVGSISAPCPSISSSQDDLGDESPLSDASRKGDDEKRRFFEYINSNDSELQISPDYLDGEVERFLNKSKNNLTQLEKIKYFQTASDIMKTGQMKLQTLSAKQHIKAILICTQLQNWLDPNLKNRVKFLTFASDQAVFCFGNRLIRRDDRDLLIQWLDDIGLYLYYAKFACTEHVKIPTEWMQVTAVYYRYTADHDAFITKVSLMGELDIYEDDPNGIFKAFKSEVAALSKISSVQLYQQIVKYFTKAEVEQQTFPETVVDETKHFLEATKGSLKAIRYIKIAIYLLERGLLFKLSTEQHVRAVLIFAQLARFMDVSPQYLYLLHCAVFTQLSLAFECLIDLAPSQQKMLMSSMFEVLDSIEKSFEQTKLHGSIFPDCYKCLPRFWFLAADACRIIGDEGAFRKAVTDGLEHCEHDNSDIFFHGLSVFKQNLD